MDEDSSAKFIGSLTKFLQSLCNGYVEFSRGVELVGHIYLNIDTGEKVDYILHERVCKNDENSVSFTSNSFHAQQPGDKDKKDKNDVGNKGNAKQSDEVSDGGGDDDDIMIVSQSERTVGSTNMGTVPNRGLKRSASDLRSPQQGAFQHRMRGNGSAVSSQSRYRQQYGGPSATVTNQNMQQQDNINIGDVKLEQLSADDLLSLATHVDEGQSSSHAAVDTGQHGQGRQDSSSGQPLWIKQEAPDDPQAQGGHDSGWPRGRDGQSDSSNSGSDLYPVMMHQNPAYSSGPVFPGQPHSHSQSLPGMPGASHPFSSPMSGTAHSMSGIDPAGLQDPQSWHQNPRSCVGMKQMGLTTAEYFRLYRLRMKQDPQRYLLFKQKDRERKRRNYIKKTQN